MRKITFIMMLLLVMGVTATSAQSDDPIRVKCDSYYFMDHGYDDKEEDFPDADWKDLETKVIVTVYFDSEVIKISNKYDDRFSITNSREMQDKIDEDGDAYEYFLFTVVDSDGTTCYVSFRMYTELNLVMTTILYSGTTYGYQGKIESV